MTTTFTDARSARHTLRSQVASLYSALSHVDAHLAGRSGLSKEQQVENMETVVSHLDQIAEFLPEILATSQAALVFAQERDFEAHQEAKAQAREEGFFLPSDKDKVEQGVDQAEAFANGDQEADPED